MGVFHIAKANLLKNRGGNISLFIVVLLVALLANTGIGILLTMDSMYFKKLDEMNSLHNAFILSRSLYKESFEDFFARDERIEMYETETVVYMHPAVIDYGGEFESITIIQNLDAPRSISSPRILESVPGDGGIPPDRAVYLPYYAKLTGYHIGDSYKVVYKSRTYEFIVAGFFEATEFCLPLNLAVRVYLPEAGFNSLLEKTGGSVMIRARVRDTAQSAEVTRDFTGSPDIESSPDGTLLFVEDLQRMESANRMTIKTYAMLAAGFALILIIIALQLLHFRVSNSIEDSMRNLGVLGALGYTSRQIIGSMVLEYTLIALAGILCGGLLSFALLPGMRNILILSSGIFWELSPHAGITAGVAAGVTAILTAMVVFSSLKIRKLPPVVALRGGIASHSFRRNRFPLDRGAGSVHIRLGLKNIFMYSRLYLMVALILGGIAATVTIMSIVYANLVTDRSVLEKMTGMEITDINLVLTRQTSAEGFIPLLETLDEVRKTSMADWVSIKIEGYDTAMIVSDDFSLFETMHPYEGSFPRLDNEIVIAGVQAKQLKKKIGDVVQVRAAGVTREYIISGLISTTNGAGLMSALSLEGYRRMVPSYSRKTVNVYLHGEAIEDFIDTLTQRFGVVHTLNETGGPFASAKARAEELISNYLDMYGQNSAEYAVMYNGGIILSGSSSDYQIEKIINYRQQINTQIDVLVAGIRALTQVSVIIAVVIIALVLSMTVKTIIIKGRTEIGILKSSGYRTGELILQMAVSFLPAALTGIIAGCFAGAVSVNPLFTALLQGVGVSNLHFALRYGDILLICIGLPLLVFAAAALSSLRIRNISVYELLSE